VIAEVCVNAHWQVSMAPLALVRVLLSRRTKRSVLSKERPQMTMRTAAFTLSVGSVLALRLASATMVQAGAQEASATTGTLATPTTPETSKEHQALADTYRKKAASYREEAATHRRMLDAYKKQVTVPTDAKSAIENSWLKKMRVHCEAYMRDAEALAAGAEKFAEFHTMRAAELQGK
jgi:hypothetical protein